MSKPLFDISLAEYGLFVGIAVLGGLVNFLQHVANGRSAHCIRCIIVAFAADVSTSAFCGFLIFLAAQSLEFSDIVTALLSGVAGHMGTRLLFVSENLLLKILKREAENVGRS